TVPNIISSFEFNAIDDGTRKKFLLEACEIFIAESAAHGLADRGSVSPGKVAELAHDTHGLLLIKRHAISLACEFSEQWVSGSDRFLRRAAAYPSQRTTARGRPWSGYGRNLDDVVEVADGY